MAKNNNYKSDCKYMCVLYKCVYIHVLIHVSRTGNNLLDMQ